MRTAVGGNAAFLSRSLAADPGNARRRPPPTLRPLLALYGSDRLSSMIEEFA